MRSCAMPEPLCGFDWVDELTTRYKDLQNKTVLVTGGATGIGAAIVAAFAAQGSQVIFIDLPHMESNAIKVIAALNSKAEKRPVYIACDIRDTHALNKVIDRTIETFGRCDVLINNAANDERMDTLSVTPDAWLASFAVNLHPVFFAARAVHAVMAKQMDGVIINLSSVNTHWAPPELAAYNTAKAGVLGLTKTLAREFGEFNIRVNAISPGWVATPKQLNKWLTKEKEAELMTRVCLKRRIEPQEVAKLALFLASKDACMITGQEFVIDGGRF